MSTNCIGVEYQKEDIQHLFYCIDFRKTLENPKQIATFAELLKKGIYYAKNENTLQS